MAHHRHRRRPHNRLHRRTHQRRHQGYQRGRYDVPIRSINIWLVAASLLYFFLSQFMP